MKIRRILGILLSVAITLCTVTGCGNSGDTAVTNETKTEEAIEKKNKIIYESENITLIYQDSRVEGTYNLRGDFDIYKIYIEFDNHTDCKIQGECYSAVLDGYSFGLFGISRYITVPAGSKSLVSFEVKKSNIDDAGVDANAISEIKLDINMEIVTDDGDIIPLENITAKDCAFLT